MSAKKLIPMRAIRAKCLDRCAGQIVEVRNCAVAKCPLYAYRMGHRPKGDKNIDDDITIGEYPTTGGTLEEKEEVCDVC